MLTERKVLTITEGANPGGEKILSVDEILQQYEIKGLSLEDLQEKYVDMVDSYEEKVKDLEDNMEEKYETIKTGIYDLKETMLEVSNSIEEIGENSYNESGIDYSIWIVLIVVFIVAFFIGKYSKERIKNG